MELLAECINNRRKIMGVSLEELLKKCGWNSRNSYYEKIKSLNNSWTLDELVAILNLFNCSFEDLVTGEYSNTSNYKRSFWVAKNISKRIFDRAKAKGVPRIEVYKAFGGSSRQNFYKKMKRRTLTLKQGLEICELLDITFAKLFLDKIQFVCIPENLDLEVI